MRGRGRPRLEDALFFMGCLYWELWSCGNDTLELVGYGSSGWFIKDVNTIRHLIPKFVAQDMFLRNE